MSGHSKWASIKHKKGAADAKRGKIFTKIIREIAVAARAGGGDPDKNPRLRKAIQDAKNANMPADNVKRAIQKGTGQLEGAQYEEVIYEGYGPGGVAIYITALSDNKNRTVSEIRHIFTKNGGQIGTQGCVAFRFKRGGYIDIDKEKADEDKLMDIALTAGAEDIKDDGDTWEVITTPEKYEAILEAIKAAGIEVADSNVGYIPLDYTKLEGKQAQQALKLVEELEDHDDVQTVAANFDIDAEGHRRLRELLTPGPDAGSRDRSQQPGHGLRAHRTPGRPDRRPGLRHHQAPAASRPSRRSSWKSRPAWTRLIAGLRARTKSRSKIPFSARTSRPPSSWARSGARSSSPWPKRGRPLFEYSPLEIKKAVTGYGQAEKNQVGMMVRALLGLEDEAMEEDASDALACALCHLNTRLLPEERRRILALNQAIF